jgi:hypothetical protein
MILKAKHETEGEVDVVGFLGTDYGKAFHCVIVTKDGRVKSVPNFTLNVKRSEGLTPELMKEKLDELQATKDTRNTAHKVTSEGYDEVHTTDSTGANRSNTGGAGRTNGLGSENDPEPRPVSTAKGKPRKTSSK